MTSLTGWLQNFYERVWHTEDPDEFNRAIDELISEDCLVYGLPEGRDIARTGFKQFRGLFHKAFERVRITIEDSIEQGDRGAFRARFEVWHQGDHHAISGGGIARFRDGQIVAAWNQWDFLGLVSHYGGVPDNSLAATLLTLAQQR